LVDETFDRPFRPKRVLNAAVLEAVMISVLESEGISKEQLAERYGKLLENEDFSKNITGGTTDTMVLTKRIEICKAILGDA
jgi:hypothetical protein